MKKILFCLSLALYLTGFDVKANDDSIEVVVVSGQRVPAVQYPSFVFRHMMTWEGYGGSEEFKDDYYNQLDEFCDELDSRRPQGCDRRNKPSLAPNGCSVPGALLPVYGNEKEYFKSSCNGHDRCYVNLSQAKSDCDTQFRNAMFEQCSSDFQQHGNPFELSNCRNDATEFYAAMVLPIVSQISQGHYEAAQRNAACVVWINEERKSDC